MKTPKEIRIDSVTFSRAFKECRANTLEGTFFPFNPSFLYKQSQFLMLGAGVSGFVFCYLMYNALFVDAVYYWHIDFPVVIGLATISIFAVLCYFFVIQYWKMNAIIKNYLKDSSNSPYGVLITDDYYVESSPEHFHVIPKGNIVRIDFEEPRDNGETYLELLLDIDNEVQIRGIIYKEADFDLKAWIQQK